MTLGVVFWLAAMLAAAVGSVLFLGFLAERGAPPHGSEAHRQQQSPVADVDSQRAAGGSSDDCTGQLAPPVDHHE